MAEAFSSSHPDVDVQPSKVYSRAYKACIRCRQTKAKCELLPAADSTLPQKGPCNKCRREGQECIFTTTRSTKRRRTMEPQSGDTARRPLTTDTQTRANCPSIEDPSVQDMPPETEQYSADIASHSGYAPSSSHSNLSRRPVAAGTVNSSTSATTSPRDAPHTHDMTQNLLRTVVTSSNDALGLLFQAAGQQGANVDQDESTAGLSSVATSHVPNQGLESQPIHSRLETTLQPNSLSVVQPETINLWNRCRFVKQGWFSAREAVTYVDLFFRNCAPLTPILTAHYADHQNHSTLVAEEPLLCCTILMISSRVHVLPGVGGSTRAHAIHDRLWHHCEHLISRITFGQEKISTARTRTTGTIESLLIMTEWHPRALHFPPHSDGWDFDLMSGPVQQNLPELTSEDDDTSALYRWQEEIFEPAKRSDRMSWMLVGSAMSLAHELGIFNEDVNAIGPAHTKLRRMRVRMLLYVYVNQLAARIGCSTLFSDNLSQSGLDKSVLSYLSEEDNRWYCFMNCWIGMTKLLETIGDIFFSSAAVTRQLLLSGRYRSLIQHFQPVLERHKNELDELQDCPEHFGNILFIDYQYIRLYMNSIAIQAVVERAMPHIVENSDRRNDLLVTNMSPNDYLLKAEVVDASCHILRRTVSLANSGLLRYAPVRLYLRIISASIFLLKAMCLGGENHDLQVSLNVLEECIQALKTTAADSMHLSSRYGTLIERHVARFRNNFIVPFHANIQLQDSIPQFNREYVRSQTGQAAGSLQTGLERDNNNERVQGGVDIGGGQAFGNEGGHGTEILNYMDNWMVQPFDPSIAPFGLDSYQVTSGFDLRSLDFLWNLPD